MATFWARVQIGDSLVFFLITGLRIPAAEKCLFMLPRCAAGPVWSAARRADGCKADPGARAHL